MNEERNEKIIELIIEELSKLKFNFKYYGTRYLIDSIYKTYCLNKVYNVNLSKEVFPELSKKYKKSIDTIHSNIKKSINIMYYDCEEEVLIEYFCYTVIKKPTVKEIVITVLEKIECKVEKEKRNYF